MQHSFRPKSFQLFKRFLKSASGFWLGRTGWLAWFLFALLIALILLQLYIQYLINFWNRDFFNALDKRDVAALWNEAWRFIPLALCTILFATLSVWAKMTAQRKWREWFSQYLINYWMREHLFFRFTGAKNYLPHPEYRIAEDARVATDLPFDFMIGVLTSVLTAITFISILWSVGGTLNLEIFGVAISIPGYLVLGVLVYSAILTGLTMLFARHMTAAVEEKNSSEAEFRSVASRLRLLSEAKVDLETKNHEAKVINSSLRHLIESWRMLCFQMMRTTFISTGNGVAASVIGLLICTPKYLAGDITLGQVVQASAAFVTVQNCFNWLLNNYPSIADWRSSTNRVANLLLVLDELEQNKPDQPEV